jgi:NADPH2:quinone reductase
VISAVGEQAKRATTIDVKPDRAGLESLAALTEAGELEVVIEEAFPLELVAQAHERLQAGRVSGKLVLVTAKAR